MTHGVKADIEAAAMQSTRPALETPLQAMHSTDFGMQFRFSLLDQALWRSCSIVPSISNP
jgi:hypothetical protein